MEKYFWCGICGGKATSGTAACSKCHYFVHLKCTNVKFKAYVRYFHQIFIFSPNSPSKTMKNAFYFI